MGRSRKAGSVLPFGDGHKFNNNNNNKNNATEESTMSESYEETATATQRNKPKGEAVTVHVNTREVG